MKPGPVPSIIGVAPPATCSPARTPSTRLVHFLDGELSPEDEAHLQEHLGGCPPCVDFVNTYRATSGMCRQALVKSMPAEVGAGSQAFLRTKLAAK